MDKKLIIGNWKMNPSSQKEAINLINNIEERLISSKKVDVVVAPPFLFLSQVSSRLKNIKLGAQDVFAGDSSYSHTGEISVDELEDVGVEFVIVGHSEKRRLGETNKEAIEKAKVVNSAGMTPVLCVGEPKLIRERGIEFAKEFVREQLDESLVSLEDNLIIAYEPVWAISSNKDSVSAQVSEVIDMVKFIKDLVRVRVLYGGSVNSSNSSNFLSEKELDGVLVGGASLNPQEFIKIIESHE